MSRLLVVLGLLAAVGVAAFVVWPRGDDRFDMGGLEDGGNDARGGEPGLRGEEADASLGGRARVADGSQKGPTWPVIPSDRIPRGGLDVFLYGPDLAPLPPGAAAVTLERVGARFWADPLPREDPESGAYRFRGLPFGQVVVRAYGPHVLETEKRAEIPLGGTGKVELFVDRGGAIHYRAVLSDDSLPEWVKLELRSARTRRPVRVVYQTESKTLHGPPKPAVTSTEGPEGLIHAIPPGDYVLHATSAEGAVEDVPVSIEAQQTLEVVIPLRF